MTEMSAADCADFREAEKCGAGFRRKICVHLGNRGIRRLKLWRDFQPVVFLGGNIEQKALFLV
jgi:hypothetical protein